MCVLSTTFPNTPAHNSPPPILFDQSLIIARNHWGVRTDCGPIAEVVASLAWLARFLIEANWSRVNIASERV